MIPNGFAAWLTINRECNLRCDWCYARQEGFNGRMDLGTVEKALRLFAGLPLKNVIIIGGEPTIHPDFLKIVQLISLHNFKPMLVTNSLAFKDMEFLKESASAGLMGISTSIKAPDNDSYKRQTGLAAFSDVMAAIKNIENIKSEKLSHKISLTICKSLFDCFGQMLDAIVESKAEMVSFDLERPIIANDKVVFDGFIKPKDMAEFIVQNYAKMESMGIRFNIKIGIPFCLFPEEFILKLVERKQIISGCQINDGSGIIIDQDGRILPCNHFCSNPIGHLDEVSTGDLYLEWRRRPDIASFYETIAGYPDERCVGCTKWSRCGGGCRIHWMHNGAKQMLGLT